MNFINPFSQKFKLNLKYRKTILIIGMFLSLTLAGSAYSDQNSQFADLVQKALKKHADRINVPGYAFALIKDGKVILNVVSGVKAISKPDKIDASTMFQSGSIAKAFTALTAVKMAQNGQFKLDDLIEKFIPARCKRGACQGIQVRHLLSHSSGISADGLNVAIEMGQPYEKVISLALDAKRRCKPGACFNYNNVAYELTREIIEKIESRPYFDVLKEKILDPIEMKNVSATFSELTLSKNYFQPHLFRKGHFIETAYSTNYYNFIASSVLNVNLEGMKAFLDAELGNKEKAVSREVLRISHDPVIEANDVYGWFNDSPMKKGMKSSYGLGHRILQFKNLKVVFLGGWLKGTKNMIAMFPEQKVGFVLLQNSESFLILRMLEDFCTYFENNKI